MSKRRKVLISFVALLVLYATSAYIVFDWEKPAYPFDEDNFNDREVAFGPRPRKWACEPTWNSVTFSGYEWPFIVYRPVCWIWRLTRNFETPAVWRS